MNLPASSDQIDLSRELPFRLGAMEVIPAAREVVVEDRREVLEPRIMQVLVALARKRDEVVTRDELIVSCWSGRVVGEDAITRCIGRIRRLSETGGGFHLETIPRLGYRLTERAESSQPPAEEAPQPDERRPIRLRFKRVWAVAASLALIAAALLVWFVWPRPQPATFSIAVLPFTAPPGDRDAEQLGDAISASIADMLVSEGHNVVSPAKARKFRGAAKADAAQALNATFVVDGEIRREGGRITVPVRIIDGATGTTLVADSIDADPDLLPEAVATRVLCSGWAWIPNLDPAKPDDRSLIAGMLKAVKHLSSPSEYVYVYDFAHQLVAQRPDSAFSHLFLAEAASRVFASRAPDARLAVVQETREAAARTLKLDPAAGDVYAPLAAATPMFNWTLREKYLREGLRVRPSAPLVYMDLIELRLNAGYFRSGGNMAEQAFANHPHFDLTLLDAIGTRLWLGDPKAAATLAVHAAKLFPARPAFAARAFEATALSGAFDEADAFLEDRAAARLLGPQGEGRTYGLIVTALRHKRPADIKAVSDDCLQISGRSPEFRHICFIALVELGRLDDAFRMAETLYPDQRGANQAEIERRWLAQVPFETAPLVIPSTAPLRADPRYRGLVERVGLLQFWKQRGRAPDFCAGEKVPLCAELKS